MKLLILDCLSRGRVLWICCSLIFIVSGALAANFAWTPKFQDVFWLFMVLFSNPFAASVAGGFARVALTLPLTSRQVGRVVWFNAVILPTIFLAVFSGLGVLIAMSSKSYVIVTLLVWIKLIIGGGCLFGSIFWLGSGAPTRKISQLAASTYAFCVFATLIGLGYLLYKSSVTVEFKQFLLTVVGLGLTILGWFRAEGFVTDYGEKRSTAADEYETKGAYRPPLGFGGIRFLLSSLAVRQLKMFLAILFGLTVYNLFRKAPFRLDDAVELIPYLPIFIVVFVINEATRHLLHLKYLRTMPLSSGGLATLILSTSLATIFAYAMIASGVIAYAKNVTAATALLKIYALSLAPLCVLTAATIWNGESRARRILVVVIFFFLSAIAPFYELLNGDWSSSKQGLSIYFVVGYPLTFFTVAWFTIRHLLESNDMTYRLRPEQLTSVQL